MHKCFAIMTVMAATGLWGPAAALAQPANDDCAGATAVFDGSNLVDNTGATMSGTIPPTCLLYDWTTFSYSPPSFVGNDVWYTYIPTVSGIRNLEIINTANAPDVSVLAIYDSCGGALLACNTAGGQAGNAKIYQFAVAAGTAYTVRYSIYQGNFSATTLNISAPQAPIAFDDCGLATPIAGQGSFAFSTAGLTNSDVQAWDCDTSRKDGWFAWTPSLTGTAVVSGCTATTAARLKLSAYTACGTAPLTCGNFQDPPTICSPRIAFHVEAGQTYHVRFGVARTSDNSTGNLVFDVRPPASGFSIPAGAVPEAEPCSNNPADEANGGCALGSQATLPAQLCTTYTGTATGRRNSVVPQSPNAYLDVDNDVYEFTLPQDDTITLTGQSEFFPRFSIQVGCDPPVNLAIGATNNTTPTVNGVYDLGVQRVGGVTSPFTVLLVAGTYRLSIAPWGGGFSSTDCGVENRYWFKITGSQPCPPALERCCRGTTCVEVASGTCTGTVAGSASVVVGSCTGSTIAGCCYGDYDHNATRDVSDIFAFLSAWFSASPYAKVGGDGTGTPTVADIFSFLSAWFAGCS